MFTTTIKMVLARRFRLVTTAFAVVLGVAFMAGTLTLTDTVTHSLNHLVANANAGTDAWVRAAAKISGAGTQERGTVPASALDVVRGVDGTAAAAGQIQGYAQLLNKSHKAITGAKGSPIGANWVDVARLNPFHLVQGRAPAADNEVVIDRATAKAAGYHVGDTATVLTAAPPLSVRIAGIAAFGTADRLPSTSSVFFTEADAHRLLAHPGSFDAISVVARPGVSQSELARRITAALPGGIEVLTGQALTAENQRDVHKALSQFSMILLGFAFVSLFVGSFVIYNTFSILVAQRSREHALMRALGASRRQVLGSVVAESATVGLIAGAVGLAVGYALAGGLEALLVATGAATPVGLTLGAQTVIVSLVVGVGVSVASAIAPARRAAKVAPIEAMRDITGETLTDLHTRLVAGVGVGIVGAAALGYGLFGHPHSRIQPVGIGAVLVFLAVATLAPIISRPVSQLLGAPLAALRGEPGRLAQRNAMRNPKRTSATAASLMIGVALIGFLSVFAASAKASFAASVDTAFKGSFVVSSGTQEQGGFPPQLAGQLATLPGVRVATGYRQTFVQVGTASKRLYGVDPAAYPRVVDLHVTAGSLHNLGDHGVGVVRTLADSHHWHLGDRVPVRFAATGIQQFTVVAIFNEKIQAPPLVVGMAAYQANVAAQLDTLIYVGAAPGANSTDIRAGLERATAAYPTATVENRAQYIKDQLGWINTVLTVVDVLLAFSVLIALMGIANTLALSIHERTREIGLLRAIGMTRRQLRTTVRYESSIIAVLGTALGLSIGLGFAWAMVKALHNTGINHFTIPATQLVAIVAVGAVAGVLAAALPARRAARLNVLKAVATG